MVLKCFHSMLCALIHCFFRESWRFCFGAPHEPSTLIEILLKYLQMIKSMGYIRFDHGNRGVLRISHHVDTPPWGKYFPKPVVTTCKAPAQVDLRKTSLWFPQCKNFTRTGLVQWVWMELGKPLMRLSYQILLQSSNQTVTLWGSEISGLDPLKSFRCELRRSQLHEIDEMGGL